MQKQFNIFGLSETWFNGSVSNDAFCVLGYYPLILLDRPHGRCGGDVASIYVARFKTSVLGPVVRKRVKS